MLQTVTSALYCLTIIPKVLNRILTPRRRIRGIEACHARKFLRKSAKIRKNWGDDTHNYSNLGFKNCRKSKRIFADLTEISSIFAVVKNSLQKCRYNWKLINLILSYFWNPHIFRNVCINPLSIYNFYWFSEKINLGSKGV